jgi:hypothetical protein
MASSSISRQRFHAPLNLTGRDAPAVVPIGTSTILLTASAALLQYARRQATHERQLHFNDYGAVV